MIRYMRLLTPLLALVFFHCGDNNDESTAELNIPVNVEVVVRSDIADYISTTGTVHAQQEERVTTEVDGLIRYSVGLNVGESVSKGQLLAEIENPEYLLDVRVESQKMAMDNAQRELGKQEALFEEGGVTEKELETARRSALDARLNYESALLRAEKIQVKSPISGIVTGLNTGANGTRITMGFQICTIQNYGIVEIAVKLPNTDLGQVRNRQQVLISNYALPDEVFPGEIHTIGPAIDPQTRTFAVTIRVINRNLRLRPGMFVKVDIIREQHPQVIVISKEALQIRDNRPVVFVVEGVMAEMREINTGIETRETVEVVAGLGEGERLVVKGHETLRDKSRVRIME
jgi:membrane fusion protein, multidrug efflux system